MTPESTCTLALAAMRQEKALAVKGSFEMWWESGKEYSGTVQIKCITSTSESAIGPTNGAF